MKIDIIDTKHTIVCSDYELKVIIRSLTYVHNHYPMFANMSEFKYIRDNEAIIDVLSEGL